MSDPQSLPDQQSLPGKPAPMPDHGEVEDSRLREARDLFAMAFDYSPVGMILADAAPPGADSPRPRTFKVNKAFADMIGRSVEELLASEDQTRFTHPEDRANDVLQLRGLLNGSAPVARWTKRYLHADGHAVLAQISVALMRTADGTPRYIIGQVEDITDRSRLQAQLVELATRDDLTGLLNRRAFEQVMRAQLDRCHRYDELSTLLLLDLDGLKQINDLYGHAAGDEAIRTIGRVIGARTRTTDTAGRLGGDEFVLLLPNTTLAQAGTLSRDIADRLRADPITVGPLQVPITVSIGGTTLTRDTPDIDSAMADADRAMYEAKRGRITAHELTPD